ncbi:DcrB-related protein [Pantoea sp. B65]|uniref:DcrB-related protein n=1 Tax=Pantoea sp. B65 TaxID=2813359 RepID=UPI0039B3C76C
MSESHATCLFTEGRITLPDQYQDRTVNVFTLSGENAPAFNISRDTLNDGEALPDYISRQLALMDKHLKGWKLSLREAAVLGENFVHGECIHASYLRDNQRVFQQQAVFNSADNHILVFTMTGVEKIRDTDSQRFQALLASFQFNT